MPDEPLTHGRDLGKFLDAYGITAPNRAEALELQRHVQMGVQVDDATHLTPPVPVPICVYNVYEAASVGLYSACQIYIGGNRGAYLVDFVPNGSNHSLQTEALGAFTATGGVTAEALLGHDGQHMETVVQTGTVVALPTQRPILFTTAPTTWLPMWFAPGRVIQLVQGTVNTQCRGTLVIQEVP